VLEQRTRLVRGVPVGDAGGHHGLAVGGDVHGVEPRVDGKRHGRQRVLGPLPRIAVGLEHAEARPQREVHAHGGAHRADHGDEELRARLDGSTPPVDPLVRCGRRERVEQVAVASVQLDAVEPRPLGAARGVDEAVDHPREVVVGGLAHRVGGR
jgi:hypothetical protein